MDESQRTPDTKAKLLWVAAYLALTFSAWGFYRLALTAYYEALAFFQTPEDWREEVFCGSLMFMVMIGFVGKRLLEIARAYYPAEPETESFVYGVGLPVLLIVILVALEQLGIG